MSDKYIITNCPSCRDFDVFGLPNKGCCYNFNDYCSRHNECVLKQIVELCKETCRKRCTNDCLGTKKHCGYGQILKLLDIQEISDER